MEQTDIINAFLSSSTRRMNKFSALVFVWEYERHLISLYLLCEMANRHHLAASDVMLCCYGPTPYSH